MDSPGSLSVSPTVSMAVAAPTRDSLRALEDKASGVLETRHSLADLAQPQSPCTCGTDRQDRPSVLQSRTEGGGVGCAPG